MWSGSAVTFPFFAYGKIYEFAKERHIIARSYKDRICMEEVFIKDGVTYMDVYVPVDNG